MGLTPAVFWRLTPREFWIKHRAWIREENRQKAMWLEHALRTGGHRFKKADQQSMQRTVTALRQYPMKSWLDQPT
jgi:hypothetical protein